MDIVSRQKLEQLKIRNSAIDDDLFAEVLQICENDLKQTLELLSIVKDYSKKEDMIKIIKMGKDVAKSISNVTS